MPLTFTQNTTVQGGAQGEALALSAGYWLVSGTLTFSGSYSTNGDSLPAATLAKRIPVAGVVREVIPLNANLRGNTAEYVLATGLLKLFSAANTEVAAAAYNAALTASPVPVAFLVRV
jgi:hypothetical protein